MIFKEKRQTPLPQIVEITTTKTDLDQAYQPRGQAIKAWKERNHEWIFAGPAETGKTLLCLQKLDALCWKYPKSQCIIGRKTYSSMRGTVLQSFEQKVLGTWDPLEQKFTGGLSSSPIRKHGGAHPQFYEYPNGSIIWVGGFDNPNKILSGERDFAFINQTEELDVQDWEILLTRCTGRAGNAPYSSVFGDCNPGPPDHWILSRALEGHLTKIDSVHEDNPTLFDPVTLQLTKQGLITMRILDSLTGVRKQRLRYGKWVAVEGGVYPDFSQDTHVVDRFTIPSEWPRYITVDYGYKNPFTCQWWAEAPGGMFILYREIYLSQVIVRHHGEAIRYLSGYAQYLDSQNPYFSLLRPEAKPEAPENIIGGISDHDAEDTATLADEGIHTAPAFKPVKIGLEEVRRRMKFPPGARYPNIIIFRDALAHDPDPWMVEMKRPYSVIQELPIYAYPEHKHGKETKEIPIPLYNHGCDAMRYLFATLFLAPVEIQQKVYEPVRIVNYA